MARLVSKPSMPGIITSMKMMSGFLLSKYLMQSSPEPTQSTSTLRSSSNLRKVRWATLESSTTSAFLMFMQTSYAIEVISYIGRDAVLQRRMTESRSFEQQMSRICELLQLY